MNAHQLDAGGVIINTIVVDSLNVFPDLVDAEIGGQIGDRIVGGVVVPKPAPEPIIPARVPMLNAHLVLIDAGWMDGITAYIDAMPEPDRSKARAYLAQALTMERTHPLVLGIPAALGKTEAEVDALFIAAAALDV